MGLYAVNFQLLSKSGLGDSWVSPQFRMTLKGHDVELVMAGIFLHPLTYTVPLFFMNVNVILNCQFYCPVVGCVDIAWQSKIHIRHTNSNGGWIHSTPGEYARDGTIGKVRHHWLPWEQ